MNKTNRSGGNTFFIAIVAFILGALFGLVVLGWWLWPVNWVSTSLEALDPAAQQDYLSAAVDSFARNSDLQLAQRRFDSLGLNKEAALYNLFQSPGTLNQDDVENFAAALGAEDVPLLTAAPSYSAPKTPSLLGGMSGMPTWLVAILAGGLLLLLLILFFARSRVRKERQPGEPATVTTYDTPQELEAAPASVEPVSLEEAEVEAEEAEPEIEAGAIPDWLRETSQTQLDDTGPVEQVDAVEALTDEDFQQISEGDLPDLPVETALQEPGELRQVAEETQQQVFEKFSRDIQYLPGVSAVEADSLRASGISVPLLLLRKGADPDGRQGIADQTGIENGKIMDWVQLVDLLRIRGLTLEDARLIRSTGVVNMQDLALQDPEQLAVQIQAVGGEASLAYTLPSAELVEDWVRQAKSLPFVIS